MNFQIQFHDLSLNVMSQPLISNAGVYLAALGTADDDPRWIIAPRPSMK